MDEHLVQMTRILKAVIGTGLKPGVSVLHLLTLNLIDALQGWTTWWYS